MTAGTLDSSVSYIEYQILSMFARNREPDFIAEVVKRPESDVEEILTRLAGDDPLKAAEAIRALAAPPAPPPAAPPEPPPTEVGDQAPRSNEDTAAVGDPEPAEPAQAPVDEQLHPDDTHAVAAAPRLLERAAESQDDAIRALGAQIRAELTDLQTLLDDEAERLIAEAAKASQAARIRAEIEELAAALAIAEQQLAALTGEATTEPLTPPSELRPRGRRHSTRDIRAWANANNIRCPQRGPIPADVVDAYEAVVRGPVK